MKTNEKNTIIAYLLERLIARDLHWQKHFAVVFDSIEGITLIQIWTFTDGPDERLKDYEKILWEGSYEEYKTLLEENKIFSYKESTVPSQKIFVDWIVDYIEELGLEITC